MHEYFTVGEYVGPSAAGKTFVPDLGWLPTEPAVLPPVSDAVIHEESRREEALQRVWALAGRRRFAEAVEQLRAVSDFSPYAAAGALAAAAELHACEPDPTVYEWLRDHAINHWYGWGSLATSPGDGAARMLEIGPAMDRFRKLDRWRKTLL